MVGIVEKKQKPQEFSCIMCKVDESSTELIRERKVVVNGGEKEWRMDIKLEKIWSNSSKVDKLRGSMVNRSPKVKQWMIRGITSIFLWFCLLQLTTMVELWRPTVIKNWPYSFKHNAFDSQMNVEGSLAPHKIGRPPKRRCHHFVRLIHTIVEIRYEDDLNKDLQQHIYSIPRMDKHFLKFVKICTKNVLLSI